MNIQLQKSSALFAKRLMVSAVIAVLAISGVLLYGKNTDQDSVYKGFEWESYRLKEDLWWNSPDCSSIADDIIKCQKPDGGWTKDMHTGSTGAWGKSTIDNCATWGQIRFLAKCYSATGKEEYKDSCSRGIDFLLNTQYENGGWPQIPGTEDYHAHITFNDDVMTRVMETLKLAAEKSGEDGFAWVDDKLAGRCAEAFDKGVECILRCQIKVNGKPTAWCQQYDEVTLEPAGGRAYELPSICTRESVGIVQLMKSLRNPPTEVQTSIQSAIEWFDEVKLEGFRFEWVGDDRQLAAGSPDDLLWARYYCLDGSTPLFADRDGKAYDAVSEISKERRTGYDWYGTWPLELVE